MNAGLISGIVILLVMLGLAVKVFNTESIPRRGRTEIVSLLVLITILCIGLIISKTVMVGEISAVASLGLMLYTYHIFVSQKPAMQKSKLSKKDYLTVMGFVLVHLWVDGKFGLNGYELNDLRKIIRKTNVFHRKWDEMLANSVVADANVDRAKFLNNDTRKEYFNRVETYLKKD